jgi:hypothetical protein
MSIGPSLLVVHVDFLDLDFRPFFTDRLHFELSMSDFTDFFRRIVAKYSCTHNCIDDCFCAKPIRVCEPSAIVIDKNVNLCSESRSRFLCHWFIASIWFHVGMMVGTVNRKTLALDAGFIPGNASLPAGSFSHGITTPLVIRQSFGWWW